MSQAKHLGRRAFLRSGCLHCLGITALASSGSAIAQSDEPALQIPARFTRPALDSDEGGLWALMDREETKLRRSPFTVQDEALKTYLQDIVCRLGGDHCRDVRVYVVRTPQFNATMAPNGMMQVWSGLLLRVENEAQLAAVLGHEIGHYLERHTLERMRDLKNKAALGTFFAAFGWVGAVAQLGVLASVPAFSREQEQRADRVGIQLMREAGYDPAQTPLIWDNLLGELKVRGGDDVGRRNVMFASHPPVEDRRDELLKLAGHAGGQMREPEFRRATAAHRLEWLKDEVRRGQSEESLILLSRLLRPRPDDAELLFARGEVYRLRDTESDQQAALLDLSRATASDQAPPDAFRSLGLLHRSRSDAPAATAAFEKYLALAPESGDAALIKTYLAESKP